MMTLNDTGLRWELNGMQAEIDRLRARNAELEDVDNRVQAMADRMAEQAADNLLRAREAERRVALLEGVLRSMQWSATSKLRDVCPSCGAWEPNGHFPDCELAAVLRKAE